MQTVGNCISSVVISHDNLFGLFHIALLILLILLELLEQTASPCDPCLCRSQPTWYCAVISFTDWQTCGQETVDCLLSLFHLFCLCLPVWVPGLLEDVPGLVTDDALLGAVLLAALLVLWCPVLASVNLFDWGDLCSLACSFSAFN